MPPSSRCSNSRQRVIQPATRVLPLFTRHTPAINASVAAIFSVAATAPPFSRHAEGYEAEDMKPRLPSIIFSFEDASAYHR